MLTRFESGNISRKRNGDKEVHTAKNVVRYDFKKQHLRRQPPPLKTHDPKNLLSAYLFCLQLTFCEIVLIVIIVMIDNCVKCSVFRQQPGNHVLQYCLHHK